MRIPDPRYAAVWVACLPHHVAAVKYQNPEGAARKNAYEIFNAIHSAMRQWGSSLNHNGLSTFVVTVPAGVTLYHGTWRKTPPPGPEWLAFEIEHAELFAHPQWKFQPPVSTGAMDSFRPLQRQRGIYFQEQNGHQAQGDDEDEEGYLQIYRTTKPLQLLYLDGMSAGNTEMGTLDFQDFVLRGDRNTEVWDELGRAKSLCDIVTGWGLQGVIRMEAGFEIIKCDFADSMELVSAIQRPSEPPKSRLGWEGYSVVHPFEFVRAVAQRYHGIGASRVALDFSSMVSAMFYPVDLSNDNPSKPNLPRLRYTNDEELHSIRARVQEVVREHLDGNHSTINWQEVTDLIVGRYADRIWFMVERAKSVLEIQGEINHLTNTHIDYGAEKDGYRAALSRCERHYLTSVTPKTQEDHLILSAMEEVTHAICERLYAVRLYIEYEIGYKYNNTAPAAHEDEVLQVSKRSIKHLMNNLRWTRWNECTTCGFHEVCFVPMWPFGDKDSYEQPNCRDLTSITNGWWDNRYWDMPKMKHLGKPPSKEDL